MTADIESVTATMASLPSQSHTLKKKPGVIGDASREPQETTEQSATTETNAPTDTEHQVKKEKQKSQTLEQLASENAALRADLARLHHDLHEAQDLIFSLQPLQQPLTETEATAEFQALVASIDEWVDQKLGDALDLDVDPNDPDDPNNNPDNPNTNTQGGIQFNLEGTTTNPHATHSLIKDIQALLNLIPAPGRAAFTIPGTDIDNIQSAILRFLTDALFSQDFYCPLPKGEREFITIVERTQRTLTPRRDTRTRRHWRVETYMALSARPGFPAYATERMWEIAYEITRLLRIFAPGADGGGGVDGKALATSFFESVVRPAAELARKMHLCYDEFAVEWSAHHDKLPSSPEESDAGGTGTGDVFEEYLDRFAEFEFVDLGSRKTLREAPPPGSGVRWMFDLRPRLVVRKLKADAWAEAKVLVPARILVSGAGKGRARARGRGRKEKEGDAALTVLGALENWLQEMYLAQARQRESKSSLRILGYFGK
ncbi:uncharacterized protein BJX67DRAFT_379254 [Aspergillus lucknowensis]|uniref:Uncharacterized protein n=1 Tax=Aspergillus lucknowensis TaxID=176173 RepID=A0ABR4M0S2_9EURO